MNYRWEHFTSFITSSAVDGREGRHGMFVREFASAVSTFQDRCDSLIEMYRNIQEAIDSLSSCAYTTDAFAAILSRIQASVRLPFAILSSSEPPN